MTSTLDRSRYHLGAGFISDDGSKFLLTIPKNASTFMGSWASQNGWHISNINTHTDLQEVIIILRDPIDRWVSGIAQYLNTSILQVHGPNGPIFPDDVITDHDYPMPADEFISNYNQLVERLLFDVIDRFDDHVYEQSGYLCNLILPDKKTYFMMGSKIVQEMSEYLSWSIPHGIDKNSGSDQENISALQIFFRQRLDQRPELVARLKKHYVRDQTLINHVATR